jgi:hypothetical protein
MHKNTGGFLSLNITANSYFPRSTVSSAEAANERGAIQIPHLRSPSPEEVEEAEAATTPMEPEPMEMLSQSDVSESLP